MAGLGKATSTSMGGWSFVEHPIGHFRFKKQYFSWRLLLHWKVHQDAGGGVVENLVGNMNGLHFFTFPLLFVKQSMAK